MHLQEHHLEVGGPGLNSTVPSPRPALLQIIVLCYSCGNPWVTRGIIRYSREFLVPCLERVYLPQAHFSPYLGGRRDSKPQLFLRRSMNRVSWSCTAGKRNSTGNSIVDPFTASGGWVVSRHLGGGPGFPRADGRGPQAEDSS